MLCTHTLTIILVIALVCRHMSLYALYAPVLSCCLHTLQRCHSDRVQQVLSSVLHHLEEGRVPDPKGRAGQGRRAECLTPKVPSCRGRVPSSGLSCAGPDAEPSWQSMGPDPTPAYPDSRRNAIVRWQSWDIWGCWQCVMKLYGDAYTLTESMGAGYRSQHIRVQRQAPSAGVAGSEAQSRDKGPWC